MNVAPNFAAAPRSQTSATTSTQRPAPPWESPQWQDAVSQNPGLAPFFDNLQSFVELPKGVEKLRELFLDLAIRGKLVSQNPSEGDGSSLLTEVAEDRVEYFKSRGLKKRKSLKPSSPDEFQVPANWGLTHLDDLAYQVHYGYTASADQNLRDVRMLRITDIQKNMVNWETVPGCEIDEDKVAQYELSDNDLLIARTGGTIGKTYLINDVSVRSVFASYLIRVIPSQLRCAEYLKRYLECPFYWRQLRAKSAGTGQPNVNATSLKSLIVPLPPLAEQRRIVSKVEGLMSLCDTLESHRRARESVRERASRSVLFHLTNAPSPSSIHTSPTRQRGISPPTETLASAWQRLSDHFEVLLDQPESISHLRQSILQLAVQGKLVPQDPSDETGCELVEKAEAKLATLIESKEIKKPNISPIAHSEMEHEIPENWAWARMATICSLITDGTHLTPKYTDSGRMFLSAQNVKPFQFMPEKHRFVSEEDYQNYIKSKKAEFEDVLLTRVGAGIGEAAVIDQKLDFAIYVSIGLLKPFKELVLPDYLAVWLNSPSGRKHSERNTYGKGVSQGNLNLSLIRNFAVSIPPSAEQKRIVSKVSVLLSQCDELTARLRSRQSTTDALLTALIHQILDRAD